MGSCITSSYFFVDSFMHFPDLLLPYFEPCLVAYSMLQVDEHPVNGPRKTCNMKTSYFVCRSFDGRELKPLSVQQSTHQQESNLNTPTSRFGRTVRSTSKLTNSAVSSPASLVTQNVEGVKDKPDRVSKNELSGKKQLFASGKTNERDSDSHLPDSKSWKSSESKVTKKTGMCAKIHIRF
jgi:hypothetical protein